MCVLESRGIMTLKRDGLGLFLLANGSDSFGRSVVKEIKLCSAAPNVGQYHRKISPLAGTWFGPSQLRLILFWGHYADGRKSPRRINLCLKGSLYVFSPQRHHYQFLFPLALYVKSTLGAPYITFPVFFFLGPLSNEIATRSPRILQRHCMAVTISSQSSPAEAAVDLLSCHASGRLLISQD